MPGLAVADGGSDAPRCSLGFPEFRHDFTTIRRSGLELLLHCAAMAGHTGSESCDYILPHQANGRMGTILAAPLGIAPARIVVTADRLGNTGSAAIWLALAQFRRTLKPGQTVLALGAEATDFLFGGFRYHHG
jgi:3-oxoacyl-[acyl-carrier-protein] synthase-3